MALLEKSRRRLASSDVDDAPASHPLASPRERLLCTRDEREFWRDDSVYCDSLRETLFLTSLGLAFVLELELLYCLFAAIVVSHSAEGRTTLLENYGKSRRERVEHVLKTFTSSTDDRSRQKKTSKKRVCVCVCVARASFMQPGAQQMGCPDVAQLGRLSGTGKIDRALSCI